MLGALPVPVLSTIIPGHARRAVRRGIHRYTDVHVLVIDEVGYLQSGADAVNVLNLSSTIGTSLTEGNDLDYPEIFSERTFVHPPFMDSAS
jgi:hypothetical protein